MATIEVFLPKSMAWLLRVFDVPNMEYYVRRDAILFAQWYHNANEMMKWPEEVQAIIEEKRAAKISMERLSTMMSKLGFHTQGSSAAEIKSLLEGYAVHEWVIGHWAEFVQVLNHSKETFKHLWDTTPSAYAQRIKQLTETLKLSPLQREILEYAFICGVSPEMGTLMHSFSELYKGRLNFWTYLFACDSDSLSVALDRDGALLRSGMLDVQGQKVAVHSFWVALMADTKKELEELIMEPMTPSKNASVMATLGDTDMELAVNILSKRQPKELGVNLLLYGAQALDKEKVLFDMMTRSNKQAWRIRMEDDIPRSVRPALGYVALSMASNYPERVLVIERPADVLNLAPNWLSMLFGVEVEQEAPRRENPLLRQFSTSTVWCMSDTNPLPDHIIGQFIYHAPLKKADRHQRQAQMLEMLGKHRIGKKTQDQIIRLEGISQLQIESAIRAAQLAQSGRGKERDAAILQSIQRSQKALGRDLTEKFKASVTAYSTKYLNTGGRFGPSQIEQALEKNRRGTLVFYGPPGTGKTQFAEYLAGKLGVPLIAKRASDLMSKWVGDNEKNIAAMFDEAVSEDAMLLLDEGDSFLRDRSFARSQWEVTMVNELLQHMERFPGIFVVCTNLFEGLDAAALRRFTFKLEFNALTLDQRWEMFLNETGIAARKEILSDKTKEEWYERLAFMQQLAAGDFATVKRQCMILGVELTPVEWLDQLEQEVKVKRKPSSSVGMD